MIPRWQWLLVLVIGITLITGCSEQTGPTTISTTAPPPDGTPVPFKISRPVWYPKQVDGSYVVPQNQAESEVK